ncbi:LysM peptidoglycan-binding domain-containing protein [Patescibacteria group bacterium]|nr:LysM peptidoglycan-binding domain-containing protein [Patescibacteria group bacterium]
MDEISEENSKKGEKKAFYVGLATIAGVILIIILTIFFIRGCSGDNQTLKEAQKDEAQPETTPAVATPTTAEGSVAGEKSELTPTPAVKGKAYTVESGDTLYEIGKKFKVDWHKIAEANGIDNSGALKVGKEIIIPKE